MVQFIKNKKSSFFLVNIPNRPHHHTTCGHQRISFVATNHASSFGPSLKWLIFSPPTFQNTLNVFIVTRSHNAAPRIIHAHQLFMLLLTYSLQVNTFMQGWHHLS